MQVDVADICDAVRDALLRSNAHLWSCKFVKTVPIELVSSNDKTFAAGVAAGATKCTFMKNVSPPPKIGDVIPHDPEYERMFLLHNTCQDAALPTYRFIKRVLEDGHAVKFGEHFIAKRVEIVKAMVHVEFLNKAVTVIEGGGKSLLVITHPGILDLERATHMWCRVLDDEGRCINIDPTIEQYPSYKGPKELCVFYRDGIDDINVVQITRRRKWLWMGTSGGNSGLPYGKIHVCSEDSMQKWDDDTLLSNHGVGKHIREEVNSSLGKLVKQ
jgi:hypothetical protein